MRRVIAGSANGNQGSHMIDKSTSYPSSSMNDLMEDFFATEKKKRKIMISLY